MIKIEAANLLNCKESALKEFCDNDVFNVGNKIHGYICMTADYRYGALVIFEVNEVATLPQVIYATPKLHYPFSHKEDGRIYHWPKFKAINVYEKLDGTNICAYSYGDANGNRFITFKTRLTPILRSGNFGDFAGMWMEILALNKFIQQVPDVLEGKFSLSFELYGGRNPHLIKYKIPLDYRLLFGICQVDHTIVLPSFWEEFNINHNIPDYIMKSNRDITSFYNDLRVQAQDNNIIDEDGSIIGTEGYVFYVVTEDDKVEMFKCKPEMVEEIHWQNDNIAISSIITTVINAVEDYCMHNDENLYQSKTFFDYVVELLKEEFTDAQIEKSHDRIKHGIQKGIDKLFLQRAVEEALKKVDLTGNKNEIMRAMSQYFNRLQMTRVFNAMRDMGIFPNYY